mgnify:CR=1 FL=1
MDAHYRRAHDLVCVSRYIRRYIHVKEGGRMKKPFRLSNLSKDIIIRLQRIEIERLKKENADMKAKAIRHLKGLYGALYGEKQV